MLKNNQLLHEMMKDMSEVEEKYVGSYHRFYIKKIVEEIEKNDLNEFRNWDSGPGGIASHGGGSTEYGHSYGWNFHPLDKDFKKIDNNFIIKNFNKLINRLTKHFELVKFLSIRSSIIRMYYEMLIDSLQTSYFDNVSMLDKNHILERVEESKIGNPIGFNKNGRFYTRQFLNEIFQIFFIEDYIKYEEIDSIIEVGSGVGFKAHVSLKVNPKLKYYLVETPPALYIAQKYLIANNHRVLTYEEIKSRNIKNIEDVNINDYDAICLAPWLMDKLENTKFDMLVNEHFFTVLEPEIVKNYLNIFLPKIKKIVYLIAAHDKPHFIQNKDYSHAGFYGLSCKDYKNILLPSFSLIKERTEEWMGHLIHNQCQLIFKRKT